MMQNDGRLVGLLGIAHSLNHSFFLIIPPILGLLVEDFNSSFEQFGLIATSSLLLYGLGAMAAGPLSDRLGPVMIIQVAALGAGASRFVIFTSQNLVTFGMGMLLMSFAASFYHPAANHLIAKVYQARTAQIMGIHGAVGTLGQIFTPAVAFWLAMLLGWRIGFVFFGILSIAVGVLFYSTNVPKAHEKREPTKILDFVKEKKMPVLLCYVVLGGLSLQDVTFFFPTFLTVERMISRDVAAYASSALLLVGAVGQFAAGAMSGRYGSKKSPS